MTPEQISKHRLQVGWLADLPEDLRTALLQRAQVRQRATGEALYVQGDPPGALYGLASGSLGVTAALGPFLPRLVHIARPGWWVGEASMVSRTQTRVEVTARASSTILVVPGAAVSDLARNEPEIWRYLGLLTVSHMDNALQLAGCALALDARDRVIATLLRLAQPAMPPGTPVELHVTQGELAEMAGLSRNPVGPILRALEKEGEVSVRRGCITISNPENLKRIVGM